jgi:pimeloyl-ACP methyl ester carboxylesterase
MTKFVTAEPGCADAPRAARIFRTHTRLGPIEHSDDGDGPALMTLHGGMGGCDQSLLLARALVPDLATRRVIAVSRPGYLRTPLASGPTVEDSADLYAALLDSLGLDRAVIAAVSAGGPSAIAFAARHPDRCAGLILVSTPSGRFESPPQVMARLKQFQMLCRVPGVAPLLGWLSARNPDKAAARSIRDPKLLRRTLADPEAGHLLRALHMSVFERLAQRLPGTMADTRALCSLPPLPLQNISAPTLIVHGESDAVVPFAHAERSARQIAGAEVFKVPAGEHVSLFTHLDEVRRRVDVILS